MMMMMKSAVDACRLIDRSLFLWLNETSYGKSE